MQFIRRSIGTQLLMAAVVLIGLYFGYSFAREVVQAERLSRQAEDATSVNAGISEQNDKLERDLQYYQSDEYVQLRARTDLNMREPDELVILPVMPKEEETPVLAAAPASASPTARADEADAATTAVAATPPNSTPAAGDAAGAQATASDQLPATARNWDRWLSLFTSVWH